MAEANTPGLGATMPRRYGSAPSGVTLAEAIIAAAWNVQGDPALLGAAAQARFGIALPLTPNTTARGEAWTALWLGPTSWLLVAHGSASEIDFDTVRDSLNGAGGALFDLTASRVAYAISGEHAETVLGQGCPLDFHPRVFSHDACAQSVIGHVNALFHRHNDRYSVWVARSLSRDVWHGLCVSAAQYGYRVNPPAPYA